MAGTNPPIERQEDILRLIERALGERLPTGWKVSVSPEPARRYARRWDAGITITPPRGQATTLYAEVKRGPSARYLADLGDQLLANPTDIGAEASAPIVLAPYLSPPARQALADRDVNYADATGNIRIVLNEPALFLSDVGAQKDPWRGSGRQRDTLKGEAPARVVRALVDFEPPYSVPELVAISKTSSGATYRVVDLLERLNLLRRTSGPITDVSWRALLDRWSDDYDVMTTNEVRSFLQPRGLSDLMERLRNAAHLKYAVTGSLAAERWAPYAPVRAAMVYADDLFELTEVCDLRPAPTGGNVIAIVPKSSAVFARGEVLDGIRFVAPSQAAVDLMNGPGRSPEEASVLLDWMETHVDQWRRQPDDPRPNRSA